MGLKIGQRVKFIGFHINGRNSTEVFEYENFLQEHEADLIGQEGVITEIDYIHTHPITVKFDGEVIDTEIFTYWKESELEVV